MKKKIVAVISATCLLAGCGSQNLGPLEEKTTKLRDDNHKLKSNIQELKQNISKENQKITSLNKDKKNMKQAKENKKKATNLKASSTYYKSVAKRIDEYNQIDADVTKNKGNKDIESKLTDINNQLDSAYSDYTTQVDKERMSDSDKAKDKDIKRLNKDLSKAITEIKDGYTTKDKKKIEKGQKLLSSVTITSN
ncbi:hypothetical protein BUZ14_09380 [Staphylococcus gallinarum]|uniref:Lipoprotein n=1 Tax=Staphylococcus gallinarum TaxID=1293 RepID=A0A3A0VYC7_STAGA|nr:hypothetical protein [Staphylococcus gallinarum]RIP34248.1 hypothetical protein BUZ14_09380 [Staphylococcus gallinarum]